jgi:hypothetical protein
MKCAWSSGIEGDGKYIMHCLSFENVHHEHRHVAEWLFTVGNQKNIEMSFLKKIWGVGDRGDLLTNGKFDKPIKKQTI